MIDTLTNADLAGLLVALAIAALIVARLQYGEHLSTPETR